MGAQEEGPDYDAIWEHIKAQAEGKSRIAGKVAFKRTIQELDLAQAINEGDTKGYIARWYPAPATAIQTAWDLTVTTKVSREEYESFVYGTATEGRTDRYPPAMDQEAADKLVGTYQPGQTTGQTVPAWLLCHCLMALGRILCLLDKARRR